MLVGFLLVCAVTQASCAAGCQTCNPADQTCTACTDSSHNIQVDGKSCAADCPPNSAPNQKVCECEGGYGPVAGQNRCEQNPSAGCAAGCQTCNPADQTCTACTDSSHNIQVDGKSCAADCPPNSAPNQKVCECEGGYGPVAGQNRCEQNPSAGCAAGCQTCNPADQTCTACTDSSHNIQVDGKSCAADCPPNSAPNQKVCECEGGYGPVAGQNRCISSSVNKSGLSTGAIAGIAVAAVIVVGGLVGFLCWWFLCRGKA
eukprot:XP_001708046.1 VSP [Giardia lamblia ATCC 50803]